MRNTRAQTTSGTRASEALVAVPAQRMSDQRASVQASGRPLDVGAGAGAPHPLCPRGGRVPRQRLAREGQGDRVSRRAELLPRGPWAGTATPESVQRAFVRAAMEVDIFVREVKPGRWR